MPETITNAETLAQNANCQYERVLEWAAVFDTANLETQRMIIANIIDRVTVGRDYEIHIEFKLTMQQFLGGADAQNDAHANEESPALAMA